MIPAAESNRCSSRAVCLLLTVLLLVSGLRMFHAAGRHSLTFDEPVHIAAGLRYWLTGDWRFNREHPPLTKLVASAPLAASGARAEFVTADGKLVDKALARAEPWTYTDQVVFENVVDAEAMIRRARLAMIACTLLFGLVVFLYARSLFGPWAGLFAALLFLADPNVLAHGCIVKNDMALAGLVLASFFLLHRFRDTGRWWWLVVAALVFGLATGTKMSALAVAPLFLLFAAGAVYVRAAGTRARRALLAAAGAAAGFLIAYAALGAAYGFTSLHEFECGLGLLDQHRETGHRAFLFGHTADAGWWYYFPVVLALKTPLPVLAAWTGGLVLLPRVVRRIGRLNAAILLIPPLVFFAFASVSRVNIGVRHVLVVFPFLAVLASALAAPDVAGRFGRRAAITLAVLLALVSLTAHPDYLSYFNGFGGGPDRKIELLGDSNLDWGQDLPRLAEWAKDVNAGTIVLGYFGTDRPTRFGIEFIPLDGEEGRQRLVAGPPGWAAVSATLYQGIYDTHELVAPLGAAKPERLLGDTWRIYRLPLSAATDAPTP